MKKEGFIEEICQRNLKEDFKELVELATGFLFMEWKHGYI